MDYDEKTAPRRGGKVRSTAPAGTPYPVAPSPPSSVPKASESQPRTVGGHTARLVVPEEEPLIEIDSLPPIHDARDLAVPAPSHAGGSEMDLPSATVGGTVRLNTVSPEEAATAKNDLARSEADQRPDAALASGATGAAGADASGTTGVAGPEAPVVSEPAGERSTLVAQMLAPVSVAVGLVFFAMGSMLTLTVEGRLIRFTLPASVVASEAHPPTPPTAATGPTPTAGATHPAGVTGTVSTAGTAGTAATAGATPPPSTQAPVAASATPAVPPASADPAVPPSAVRPPVPPSSGARPPQGGTKRPPIIF